MSMHSFEFDRFIDVLRPGLGSLAGLDDVDYFRTFDPPNLRFSARIEVSSDRRTSTPWVKGPVALEPGEPIAVKWELQAGTIFDVGTSVTARIEFGAGHVLYTSPPVPLKEGTTGVQNVDVLIESPVVANLFYKFGARELRLIVNGNGSKGGPYSRKTAWTVVAPSAFLGGPFTDMFSWSGGERPLRAWKEKFVVGGTFNNQSRYTALQHVHLRLSEETLNWHSAAESRNDYADAHDLIGPIAPGDRREKQFPIAAKDFYWMEERPTWAATPLPHLKYYRYHVQTTMTDIYGNRYGDVADEGPTVEVKVSQVKENWQSAAVSAAISAVYWSGIAAAATVGSIFTFGISAAAAAAAALAASASYVAAEVAGKKALDPPEPDDDFMAPVEIEVRELAHPNDGFEAIGEFLSQIVNIICADNALTAIEGKLLGAQVAQSEEGIRLQAHRYDEVRGWIVERYRALEHWYAPALRELSQPEELWSSETLATALEVAANGLPDETVRQLEENRVPMEDIEGLQEVMISPELRDVARALTPADALSVQLRAITYAVRHILRYRPDAMADIA